MTQDLPTLIRLIQGEVGVKRDGVCGPVTAANVLAALQARHQQDTGDNPDLATTAEHFEFDSRSEAAIAGLDRKAQPMFRKFLALAKATAATYECDYVLISGYRTWAEQDALYAQGRTKSGPKVTNAPGGYSNHNFKTAADAGVFLGKIYLDGGSTAQQAKAHQVHQACAHHAAACGLVCGASWTSMPDEPHYQVDTGHASPTPEDREKFQLHGTIL